MIPRYTPATSRRSGRRARRYAAWLEVELAACTAMEAEGLVPVGTADAVRAAGVVLDPERIEAIEAETRHDVIAFLTHVEEQAGPPARWLHRGMTSSDVLDTSLAMLLRDAVQRLITRADLLLDALQRRIEEHRRTVMIGRSHGIHAEPITFGQVLAGHYAEVCSRHRPARHRARRDRRGHHLGRRGHLGAPRHPPSRRAPWLRWACGCETVPTQVVPRDRHAACFFAALAVGRGRHRALRRAGAPLAALRGGRGRGAVHQGQKGSSAMPHKRNPIASENLCGLARMMRAYAGAALENAALWHERDISHSSAERMIAPDATTTLAIHARPRAQPRLGPRGVPRPHGGQPAPQRGPVG